VTTEINNGSDPISEEQAKLDEIQGETPHYVTSEQFETMLKQIQTLQAENRGLQGKIDSGLTAIRRDSERARAEERQREADALISNLPEDQREYVAPILKRNAELEAWVTTQGGLASPNGSAGAASNELQEIVRDMGVDPFNPGINYSALQNPSLTESQRRQAFFSSVDTVKQESSTPAPTPPAPPAPPAPSSTVSPPVGSTPNTASEIRNIDDVRSAFIEGRLSQEDYRSRMSQLGHPVG
jgi:hypothetical protein